MTDIEQLKYVAENGTCHGDIPCRACTFGKCCLMRGSLMNYLNNTNQKIMQNRAKELLNELRIKKLERIND
jgi:predicted metal-binding transcription factor (methanogenesis marker protein 9)